VLPVVQIASAKAGAKQRESRRKDNRMGSPRNAESESFTASLLARIDLTFRESESETRENPTCLEFMETENHVKTILRNHSIVKWFV